MGRIGKDYGSERHLLTYRRDRATELDQRILDILGLSGETATIQWLYPDRKGARGQEPRGVSFLRSDGWSPATQKALAAWSTFWPQRGMPPSWDGVGVLQVDGVPQRWLLVEAKANHPEFTGAPCRASAKSFETIQKALNTTKRVLGVHRHFDWTGSYYQFANRLTLTRFLIRHGVPATLVEVFFTNDCFPDGRTCPSDADAWAPLLEARRLTLGLSRPLTADDGVVDVFVPAVAR